MKNHNHFTSVGLAHAHPNPKLAPKIAPHPPAKNCLHIHAEFTNIVAQQQMISVTCCK